MQRTIPEYENVKTLATAFLLSALLAFLTGCGLIFPDVMIAGSEKGIRSWRDGDIGLATSAQPQHHYKLRGLQETEHTARALAPSMLENIFRGRGGK